MVTYSFNDSNNIIDVCTENIYDFSSAIKSIHGSQPCKLESSQIRAVCEHLENHLKESLKRSKRLLEKNYF